MTAKMQIELQSVAAVKRFIHDLSEMDGQFILLSGNDRINAKSILEILALDLSKPLQLVIENSEEKNIAKLKKYTSPDTLAG